MHTYELVAQILAAERVSAVFGLMGEDTAPIVVCLEAQGIDYVACRQEAGAVAAADAYARLTGRIGAAVVSRGPGLANSVTALTAARRAGSRLLVLTGDAATHRKPHIKDISHDDLLKPTGVGAFRVTSAADVAHDLREALRHASDGVPVVLNLPVDLLHGEAPDQRDGRPSSVVGDGTAVTAASRADINDAHAILASAVQPMILAGRGSVASGAGSILRRLAEKSGAILGTTLLAKGLFVGDPFDVGVVGGFSGPRTLEIVRDADCVVAFGASLNARTTKDGSAFSQARVIQIDTAPTPATPTTNVECRVQGDALAVANSLIALAPPTPEPKFRTEQTSSRIRHCDSDADFSDASTDEAVDPRILFARLEAIIPKPRSLVVDGGHFCGLPCRLLSVQRPQDFVFACDFGSIGLGLGSSVGAAVAANTDLTVLAVGDGGFMMALPELETAVRYRLPIVMVVVNDQAYGSELHYLREMGLSDKQSRMSTPSLEAVAGAIGADGVTVRRWQDLDALAARLRGLAGPLVVDCRVTLTRLVWV